MSNHPTPDNDSHPFASHIEYKTGSTPSRGNPV